MSDQTPKGLYVYQPFGSVSHPERAKAGLLWAVSGFPEFPERLTIISGLTRAEAEAIRDLLTESRGKK